MGERLGPKFKFLRKIEDLNTEPVRVEEELFVRLLILHLSASFEAIRDKMLVHRRKLVVWWNGGLAGTRTRDQ